MFSSVEPPQPNLPASRMSALTEYFFAVANKKIAEQQAKGMKVLNLGIGSPDLPPTAEVLAALSQTAADPTQHVYPSYTGLPALRVALAEWYQRYHSVSLDPTTSILPVAGSKEAIFFLTLALIGPGDAVLVPNPGYATYGRSALIAGGEVVEYPLTAEHNYLPDLATLARQDLSRVKMMWINYPHNPTGAVATREDLARIMDFGRQHGIIIASDNPYSHLTFDQAHAPSLLEVANSEDLAVELNSFSKTYNMAGWRLGWAAGHPEIIKLLTTIYSNAETGVFLPIQHAGVVALQTPDTWIAERNRIYQDRIEVVTQLLAALDCQPLTPRATLYVWAKLPARVLKAEAYCFELLEKTSVFITPGTAFGSAGEGYVRAAVCQPKAVFEEALQRVKAVKS